MAIVTADGWFAAAKQQVLMTKTAASTGTALQPQTLWSQAGSPGAGTAVVGNTTTGVLFTDATAGAPTIAAFGAGNTGYLAQAVMRNSVAGSIVLYDRIWGAGAVSFAAVATTTFTGHPSITQRLPKPDGTNPDYGNLEMFYEVTTGLTGTGTVAIGYTAADGTTGRSSGALSSAAAGAGRLIPIPLQAGDKGVQKIDSINVSVANTAGAANLILARRIATFDIRIAGACDIQGWDALGGPVLFHDSCLWLVSQADSTSSGTPSLNLTIING